MKDAHEADRVVRVTWPVYGTRLALLGRALDGLSQRVASLERLINEVLGVGAAPSPAPGAPTGPQGVLLTAQGHIDPAAPVMAVADPAARAATLAATEAGVASFVGFAGWEAEDGDPVWVWYSGPCALFGGLQTAPALPDTLELYVYGPGPPVAYSSLPADAPYRACGICLSATTILLSRGDVFRTPPPP